MEKETINYDPEEVMRLCEYSATNAIYELQNKIDKLCDAIEDCQEDFHCKGSDENNVINKIYYRFHNIIGENNKDLLGIGLYGYMANAAKLINICYNEANTDYYTLLNTSCKLK